MVHRSNEKQSEHDRVVEASAATWRRNSSRIVYTNPGSFKNYKVNQNSYPDVVVTDGSNNIIAVEEVETEDSVIKAEISQWGEYAGFGVKFNLIVPIGKVDDALSLTRNINNVSIQGYGIENGEIYFS